MHMNQFETFLQLHHSAEPLLLGNAWDVGSASLLQDHGFKAVATSSAALANAMGYEDGENLPFELLLQCVRRIKDVLSVPFSVDMEGGYSKDTAGLLRNITMLCEMGVSGINLEDSQRGAGRQLQSASAFSSKLSAVADHCSKNNLPLFINARTDAYLLGLPGALEESIQRAKFYQDAGAAGIFVPMVTTKPEIRAIVGSTKLPLNVLAHAQLPGIPELSAMGVRRISLGSSLYRDMNRQIVSTLDRVRNARSFAALFTSGPE
jgi:2-methylisocitrate lyase-like PEP mutase family enzyme